MVSDAPTVSKAAFSRSAGVTRGAISIALAAGRIRATADGRIDPADPLNAAYLTNPKRQRRQAQRQTGRSPGAESGMPPADPEAPSPPRPEGAVLPPRPAANGHGGGGNGRRKGTDDGGRGGESYDEADTRWKRAQADKVELDNRIKRSLYIERVLVDRFLKRLHAIDTAELRTIGDRMAARMAGLARAAATDEQATMDINRALTDDIYRSLLHAQTLTDDFLSAGATADWEPEDVDERP